MNPEGGQSNTSVVSLDYLFESNLISMRLYNALTSNGFTGFRQVLSVPFSNYSKLPHVGKKCLTELSNLACAVVPIGDRDKYSFFEKCGLNIPSNFFDTPISLLNFSRRTKNALLKSGYKCLGNLDKVDREKLLETCRGLGTKGVIEIFDSNIIDEYIRNQKLDSQLQYLPPSEQLKYCSTISDFVRKNFSSDYFDLFISKFDGNLLTTIKKHDITKQRAYQKINKVLLAIKNGIITKKIAPFIVETIKLRIEEGFLLNDTKELDPILSNHGIVKIIDSIFPSTIILVGPPIAKSAWAFAPSTDIKNKINHTRTFIKQKSFYPKDVLIAVSELKVDFLEDLPFVHKYENYYSHIASKNKFNICKFIDDNKNRIFTVQEICNACELDNRYVRSVLLKMTNIINVGLSKYAVSDSLGVEKGESYKTLDIIVNLLKKEGCPINKEILINEVLKIRDINRSSVIQAIYFNKDTVIEIDNNKLALTEWGYKEKRRDKIVYENKLETVILEILKASYFPLTVRDIAREIANRYGDTASDNHVSIHAALQTLKQKYAIVQSTHGQEVSYFLDED